MSACPFSFLFSNDSNGTCPMSGKSIKTDDVVVAKESSPVSVSEQVFGPLLPIPAGPSANAYPVIGNHLEMSDPANLIPGHTGIHASSPALMAEHGAFFRLQVPDTQGTGTHDRTKTVFCADPELISEIMQRPEDFQKLGFKHSPIRKTGGNGIFSSDDDEPLYHAASRILRPAFSQKGMKSYFSIVQESVATLAAAAAARTSASPETGVEVHSLLSQFTFEVIGRICFSVEHHAMTDPDACKFLQDLDVAVKTGLFVRTVPNKLAAKASLVATGRLPGTVAAREAMKAHVNGLLESRRAELAAKARTVTKTVTAEDGTETEVEAVEYDLGRPLDMLERMLALEDPKTGTKLDDDTIRSNIMNLLIAGHDSTSSTITYLLQHVAMHPHVERQVYEEVVRVCGSDPDAPITWEMLSQLTYCDQVVQENLRINPAAPAFFKRSPEGRATTLGPYEVPAGTDVFCSTWGLARNPEVWDEPAKFDPSRWEPEKVAARHPFASLPFSYGTRGCIGRQLSLIEQRMSLAHLVRRFAMRVDPSSDIKSASWLFVVPEGLQLRFDERPPTTATPTTVPRPLAPAGGAGAAAAISADALDGEARAALAEQTLVVLYGSNTGTAEDLARRVAANGRAVGMATRVATLDAAAAADDASRYFPAAGEGATVIVTSTYNGQAPDNAAAFEPFLATTAGAAAVARARVAVFAVGNSQWSATFLAFPRRLQALLEAAGAECLLAMGEADVDKGQEEWELQKWEADRLAALLSASGLAVPAALRAGAQHPELLNYEVLVADGLTPAGVCDAVKADSLLHAQEKAQALFAKRAFKAEVVANRELLNGGAGTADGRSTRHVEVKLPDGVTYKAGDHLGVVAANPEAVVLAYLARVGMRADAVVRVATADPADAEQHPGFLPLSKPMAAFTALSYFYELQQPVTRTQLHQLAGLAADAEEQARLTRLSGDDEGDGESDETYASLVAGPRRTLLEVLALFPSVEVRFAHLLALLPPLKPRYYSISSSPLGPAGPSVASISVSVVRGESPTGRAHAGVASNFLASCLPGQPRTFPFAAPGGGGEAAEMGLYCFVKDTGSSFRLPADPATPVIMVGPGTGVAPMRGFLQERAAQREQQQQQQQQGQCGENVLFYGCRDDADYIYRSELEGMSSSATTSNTTIDALEVAFSRKQAQGVAKTYVQQRIAASASQMLALLKKGAHVYVCGDASKMAPDVKAAFTRILTAGGDADAEASMALMVEEGRYCQDVWAAQSRV